MAPEGVCKQRRIARFLKTIVFGAAIGFSLPALAQTDIAAGCEAAAICAEDLAALLAAEAVPAPAARLGNAAVSISVDGEALVGSPADEDADRRADVDLEAVDIQIKFDGLDAERSLSVATAGEGRIHTPEALIEFIGHWNYPAWIERAEVRIFEAPGLRRRLVSSRPVAIVALDETGRGAWLPGAATTGSFVYVLRVYDAYNRFDETEAQRLEISDDATLLPQMVLHGENSGRGVVEERPASPLPGYDVNQLARSAIPIEGGAVTVYGRNLPQGLAVSVMGRDVPVAPDRDFVIQTILPAGEHLVDVAVSETGGSRSVEFARAINIPTSQWFYVGLADLTVGRRFGKDSKLLAPVKSGEYSPVYRKGRLAFYLKGKIRGRYILTASLDTDEENLDTLFSGMDRKDPRQLLRRLDPDDYYPVYGDDSILKEDAPTAGKFYVRIDRGSSHVMWGNFKTRIDGVELARYERALYGAEADLRSPVPTRYGDPSARLQLFGAQPGTLPQRDVFRGTGGSVYFLKRSDINQGSEQIAIELRDAVSGQAHERKPLREGEDYTIDYVQGVLILSKPLAATAVADSAVLPSSLASYDQYLVATYEYTPTLEEVDGYSYGGRAEAWVFDALRFGVTGYQENTGMADPSLVGADATWRLSESSYFQFEWARSQGESFPSVVSSDGGFIFKPVTGEPVSGPAQAWRAVAALDLGELSDGKAKGSIGVGYEQREKGFNAPGRYSEADQRIWDAHLEIEASDTVTIKGRYAEVARQDGVSKRDAGIEVEADVSDALTLQAGVLHSDSESSIALSDGTGSRTDVGGRVTFNGAGDDKLYVFGQTTVAHEASRRRNDRVGAGFKTALTPELQAEAEVSTGTTGIGLLAGLSYEPDTDDRYFIGYRMLPDSADGELASYDPFGRDFGSVVIGARHRYSETVAVWTEHNFDRMGPEQGALQAYGVELQPDALWKIAGGIEYGTVTDEEGVDFARLAPSLAIAFKDGEKTLSSRLEVRLEDSDDDSRDRVTWLGQANLGLKYDDNWRFLAKIDAAISQSDQSATLDGDYIEASVGWAYRPAHNDRFNALFKYTYLHVLPGPEQVNSDNVTAGPKQRSHVLSGDFIYDLTERLSVGAKYGLRIGEISTSRDDEDFVRSTAQLGIVRADYHVVKNWDLLFEGRALWLSEPGQVHYGALAGIYRHLGNNLKIGVGYNFGRFSDDLTDLTLDDQGVFVNVIGKF